LKIEKIKDYFFEETIGNIFSLAEFILSNDKDFFRNSQKKITGPQEG